MRLGRAICPSIATETVSNGLVNFSWVLAWLASDQQNWDWNGISAFTNSLDF